MLLSLRILPLSLVLLLSSVALADSADISVVPSAQRYPDRMDVLFAMVNRGPDVARKAVLTFEVPEGLTVSRLSYGAGDTVKECDASQRPIRCEVGDMHVGQPFHYGSIVLNYPVADASYVLRISLTSETPDPTPANNSGTLTWETKIESDLGVLLVPETERVDPGGAARFRAQVCNNARDNRPPTVRAEFTATGGMIAAVAPANGFTCRIEGDKAVCTIAEFAYGCPGAFVVETRAGDDRRGGEVRVTARLTGDLPDTNPANNEDSEAVPVYRWLTVDTVADAGPGSLREAMTQANAGCTPGPCRIVFQIPKPVPDGGFFTIIPATPLPSITAERVTLEGGRQTAFTGNTNQRGPEIAIDGRLAHRGIRMLATCEGVVEGLAIGNFDEDQGLWISTGGACGGRPDRREVADSHIGMDPTGFVPWPNRRGIRADFAEGLKVTRNVIAHNRFSGFWMWRGSVTITSNFIDQNGASGIFLGPEVFGATLNDNVIRSHPDMGIAIARGPDFVQMRRNSMRDNAGLGIDWGLDGVSATGGDDHQEAPNAPVLLSARYDPARNVTTVHLTLGSKPLGPYFNYGTLEFFRNEGPDGDGEWFIGSGSQGQTVVSLPGDYRGKWINATWTREHSYGSKSPRPDSHFGGYGVSTSELSNSVLVE